MIYSRGRESGSAPTAYVMVNPVPERVAAVRREGLAAVTLDRGLPATGVDAMPWLLASAKTLSYAVNMAALRHAARQGAGDVIFVSSDGYVLEGPRSTVVIATDSHEHADSDLCLLTPPPWYPILRGTTQQALFEVARTKGYDCDYRALRVADLFDAQGIWLVSSMTLAARVHTLDGRRCRARRSPRNSPNWSTPRSSATAEPEEARVILLWLGRYCGYFRPYTRKEVVRELLASWTCEVATR